MPTLAFVVTEGWRAGFGFNYFVFLFNCHSHNNKFTEQMMLKKPYCNHVFIPTDPHFLGPFKDPINCFITIQPANTQLKDGRNLNIIWIEVN